MSQPPRPRFGTLLTEAISSIARRKQVNMEIVEEDLAIAISESENRPNPLTFHTVQRWMRGHPPNCQRVKVIVEFCARQGRISRDLAEGLLKNADCEHLISMLDNLFGQRVDFLPPHVCSNLSRRNPDIRGRETEKAELIKRLSPENRAAVIVIYGLGGIGKTTLAIEVAHSCLPGGEANFTSDYETVVFTSARDRKLTLSGVLDEIGRILEIRSVLRESPADKMPLVQDILRRFQVLLIIDNFETIDDYELTRFALEGVPAPSKVVITTRDYNPTLWPGTWPIHLKGLDDTAALQLVREWAHQHELAIITRASNTDLVPLLRATEGNPYALLTALGLIANQRQPLQTVLRDLWEGRGRIFDFIFGRAWELLDEPERRITLVMPFFTTSATSKAIGATAGLESYAMSRGLGRLAELSLVIPDDDEVEEEKRRYRVHPLTRAFAEATLREMPELERETREFWSDFYLQYVERYGDDDLGEEIGGGKAGHRERLKEEIKNIRAAIEWCFENNSVKVVRLVERITTLLLDEGEWAERLNLCKRTLEIAETPESRAGLLTRLAWSYQIQADYDKAQKVYDEALEIARQNNIQDRLVHLLRDSGRLYSLQGNYAEAVRLCTESLELAERIGQEIGILLAKHFRARAIYESGELQKSKQEFFELLPRFRQAHPRQLLVTLRFLGNIAISEGGLDEARTYLQDALENVLKRYYEAHEKAQLYQSLGDLEKACGNLDQARDSYEKALDLANRLGMEKEMELLVEELEHLHSHSARS